MSAYFLRWECQFSVSGEISMNDDAWISKKEIAMKSIQMSGDECDEYDDYEKRIWNERGNFYDDDCRGDWDDVKEIETGYEKTIFVSCGAQGEYVKVL